MISSLATQNRNNTSGSWIDNDDSKQTSRIHSTAYTQDISVLPFRFEHQKGNSIEKSMK